MGLRLKLNFNKLKRFGEKLFTTPSPADPYTYGKNPVDTAAMEARGTERYNRDLPLLQKAIRESWASRGMLNSGAAAADESKNAESMLLDYKSGADDKAFQAQLAQRAQDAAAGQAQADRYLQAKMAGPPIFNLFGTAAGLAAGGGGGGGMAGLFQGLKGLFKKKQPPVAPDAPTRPNAWDQPSWKNYVERG